jgi:hypothetical protein
MFKYFRIRSKYFIRFTWFLLFALFADTVNLDDYLPHSFSIHLDDIDMIDQNVIDDILSIVNGSNNLAAHTASCIDENTPVQSPKDIVILYDLDSLALAATTAFEKETVLQSVNSEIVETTESLSAKNETSQSLYLQFQSLKI